MSKDSNQKRDDVLRQMLKTPPKPHKPIGGRQEKKKEKNDDENKKRD